MIYDEDQMRVAHDDDDAANVVLVTVALDLRT